MTLVEDLKWRGLIKDISSPELEEKLNQGGLTFYVVSLVNRIIFLM